MTPNNPAAAGANAAKFLGARASFDACTRRPVMTLGGISYAKEFVVERLFREFPMLPRIAPSDGAV